MHPAVPGPPSIYVGYRTLFPLYSGRLGLSAGDFRGNVRELRTAIEHGVVMSNEQSIERHHLPDFLDQTEASPLLQQSNEGSSAEKDLAPTDEFNLHALEMHAIRSALRHTSGNRTKAADLLGISRRTLQRKLKDLSTT